MDARDQVRQLSIVFANADTLEARLAKEKFESRTTYLRYVNGQFKFKPSGIIRYGYIMLVF